VKITFSVGYQLPVPALVPRCLSRVVTGAVGTLRTVPLLGSMLGELRDAVRHIERLAGFAATELPELVYQLEKIREQLAAIERKINAGKHDADSAHHHTEDTEDTEDTTVSRDGRRTG
jgi:hypothetical protein